MYQPRKEKSLREREREKRLTQEKFAQECGTATDYREATLKERDAIQQASIQEDTTLEESCTDVTSVSILSGGNNVVSQTDTTTTIQENALEGQELEVASIISSEMDIDKEYKATKRKKAESPERDNNSDQEPCSKIVVLRRRNNIDINIDNTSNDKLLIVNNQSDADKLFDAATKESICDETEPDYTTASERKDDGKRKVGRPKKKTRAVDSLVAEREIVAKLGKAPEHVKVELLKNMTAADVSAQALDYIGEMDHIRTKCGHLQGGLSGELRKRMKCLEDLIKALQYKADAAGDLGLLKNKITELLAEIRKNKLAEEKRKRKMEELHEVIKELKRENKGMREKMRRIKESGKK